MSGFSLGFGLGLGRGVVSGGVQLIDGLLVFTDPSTGNLRPLTFPSNTNDRPLRFANGN